MVDNFFNKFSKINFSDKNQYLFIEKEIKMQYSSLELNSSVPKRSETTLIFEAFSNEADAIFSSLEIFLKGISYVICLPIFFDFEEQKIFLKSKRFWVFSNSQKQITHFVSLDNSRVENQSIIFLIIILATYPKFTFNLSIYQAYVYDKNKKTFIKKNRSKIFETFQLLPNLDIVASNYLRELLFLFSTSDYIDSENEKKSQFEKILIDDFSVENSTFKNFCDQVLGKK